MYNSSKKIITSNEEVENMEIEAKEELLEKFEIYISESGWEDWMEDYTSSEEDEEITEREAEKIENIQAENFLKVLILILI